jgi:WD40 repeat protein
VLKGHFKAATSLNRAFVFLLSLLACAHSASATEAFLWFHPGHVRCLGLTVVPTTGDLLSVGHGEVKRWVSPNFTFSHTVWTRSSGFPRVAVTADGSIIAVAQSGSSTGSFGDPLEYYSVEDGTLLASFQDSGRKLNSIDLAPNGAFVLLGGRTVLGLDHVMWQKPFLSGATTRTYNLPSSGDIFDLEIAPSSQSFVVCQANRLSFWRVSDSTPYFTLPEPTFCAAFSSDGQRVATGHQGGKIIIWDLASATQIRAISFSGARNSRVYAVEFDPVTGNVVAGIHHSMSQMGEIATWSPLTQTVLFSRAFPERMVFSLATPPAGDSFFLAGRLSGLLAFDRSTGAPQGALTHSVGSGVQLHFAGDGLVASRASGDSQLSAGTSVVRVKSAGTGELLWSDSLTNVNLPGMTASRNGSMLAAGDLSSVKVYEASTGNLVRTIPHDTRVGAVAFSPNGSLIAFADDRAAPGVTEIIVHSTVSWQQIARFPVPHPIWGGIEFTPDGSKLLVSLEQGLLQQFGTVMWNLVSSTAVTFNTNAGCEFAISPDSRWIAVSWHESLVWAVKVHDLSTMEVKYTIPNREPSDMVFSNNGQVLWMSDDRIYAYRSSTGEQLYTTSDAEIRQVSRIAISPREDKMAFSRWDGSQGIIENPLR